ncbi:YafY family transcriptional regulator [Hoyosella rhizosphaerae]|uniref:DeoR family transcriptional regulator n=1 Tax=Hoyosella rhizosphaerae TaxID=1755582 RepID=A0A916U0Z6_9ACTN|nr:YafY family protein [Hoyosella rhizosphaerae]MBN4926989.1 YafY family transcriptional regulator [Hoyosella rhizosphaerae]GGC54916.1 DeoR family transcriptional regulator [Hoyosella rhizosphaerae]
MSNTTERVLRLLSLLQAQPVWTGEALAERLGVTARCIRRDVDRLRELGYPVNATQGVGGGYRLGAGKALPPLLLDDGEAVAVAVALRLTAGVALTGATAVGASESALEALTKLDKVMPPRLRAEIRAIQDSIDVLGGPVHMEVSAECLLTLARCCQDQCQARFAYGDRDGKRSFRRVEPVRLVSAQRRWYLMAWDLDRDDWRTFRLDRMTDVVASTFRFRPREHPDPAEYVRRSVTTFPHRFMVRVVLHCSLVQARAMIPQTVGTLTEREGRVLLEFSADDLRWSAMHLSCLDVGFEVLDPPEMFDVMRGLAKKLTLAADSRLIADRNEPISG